MKQLTDILAKACAAIEPAYFFLQIDGGDQVYIERVYCYELYHQIRLRWPADARFYLNGELDKAAHPILKELGASHAKPDLLVHTPGSMKKNHCVIEVKSPGATELGIRADLEKLNLFLKSVGYQRAIYLLYGHEAEETLRRVRSIAGSKIGQIELCTHSNPGELAKRVPSQC